MVIDRGKLIALLVDKTGRTKEDIAKDLDELLSRIRGAAESERQFHIDSFGTFSKVDGNLHFDPDSQLKTEINQKYAGMKPIELMEPFKESGSGIPVEENGHKTIVPGPAASENGEEAEHDKQLSAAEEVEDEENELDKSEAEQEENKPRVAPVPAADKEVAAEDAESSKSSSEEFVAEEKTTNKKFKPRRKMMRGNNRNGNSGLILLVAFFVIAVLAGGWFLFGRGMLSSTDNEPGDTLPADTTNQSVVQSAPAASDTMGAADSMEQSRTDSVSQSNNGSQNTNAEYGLKGAFNENDPNAFTIVIHSFRLRSTVQNIADSLGQEGYRTVLFDGLIQGENRWRIGIGQFPTAESAQDATQRLPSPYREDHFIQRIQ